MDYLWHTIRDKQYGEGIVISRAYDECLINALGEMYKVYFPESGVEKDMNIDYLHKAKKIELCLKDKGKSLKIGYKEKYNLHYKYIDHYFPRKRFKERNAISEIISNYKFGEKAELFKAKKEVEKLLFEVLPEGSNVCVVPSSQVKKVNRLNDTLQAIADTKHINIIHALKRITDKGAYAFNLTSRDPENDIRTAIVQNKEKFYQKDIILLDDVCTTGSTFYAFSKMLMEAGAKSVECICVGSTIDMDIYNKEKKAFALMQIKGIGKKTIHKLMVENGDLLNKGHEELIELITQLSKNNKRIVPPTRNEFETYIDKATLVFEEQRKKGIDILLYGKDYYPKQFYNISTPPVLLYAKGNLNLLEKKDTVAIIGSRNVTDHGARAARRLGEIFAEKDFTVVSGLAIGCDTEAHKGCLEKTGDTIAILPSPIDDIQPKANEALAKEIIDNNGLLLSEYYTGQEVINAYYAERDRLQSAISIGVIVVETSLNGGTMITVEHAIKQGKLLACYRHPKKYIGIKETEGNSHLIEENKAIPIDSRDAIEYFANKMIVDNETVAKYDTSATNQIKFEDLMLR